MKQLTRRYILGRMARQEIVPLTAKRMRVVLTSFADNYGNRPVKNLSRTDIERWIASRPPLASGTRRYEISTIRAFTKWLQRERHITRDPMLDIRNPKVPRGVPRSLSLDETHAIEDVLPDSRAWAIYALMRWEGLRRIEVRGLEVGDWDRHRNTVRVVGKGAHVREIPVTGKVARVLNAYLDESPAPAGPLIRRHDGTGPISTHYLGQLMGEWMRESGVKQAPWDGRGCHSLRHTIATEVADVEPDLRVVQEMLGHEYLTSTQIYVKRTRLGHLRDAMERAAS